MISHEPVNLLKYDLILVNTSGGKDSSVAAWYVCQLADRVGALGRVRLVHATFPEEWEGTVELVKAQAAQLGVPITVVSRGESLLDYVRRRRKWPSPRQRYCTSDFKRAPIDKVITQYAPGGPYRRMMVLNIMGIRADESHARAKREPFRRDARRTNRKRIVDEWLPIFRLTVTQVWAVIRQHGIPYHPAYDLGMPRLSCRLCIYAPREALVLAGRHNRAMLQEYVQVEREIGHTFRPNLAMAEVLAAVERDESVGEVRSWQM